MVMDADFNGVWVDEADLDAHFIANAARPGTPAPAAADDDNQNVELVTQPHPPLSQPEWRNLGFDPAVADALAECGASRVDLAANPPLTAREVLSSVHPWIGSSTAAVTAAVALSALDFAQATIPPGWRRPPHPRQRLCLQRGVCLTVGPRLRSRVLPKGGPVL